MSQPSPLTPARQHALALASAGDLAGARHVLERAVELGKVNLSEDDPDVLRTSHQLGAVLQRADDPSAARRVLEEAYAAGLWRLGESDPLMLEISHDIGVVAEELGNRHEARKAFGRVAELGPGVLGDDHPAVMRARDYLGLGPVRAEAEPTAPIGVVAPVTQAPPADDRQRPAPDNGQQPAPDNGQQPAPDNRQRPAPDNHSSQPDTSPIAEATVVQPVITPRGANPVPAPRFPPAAAQQRPASRSGTEPAHWSGTEPAHQGANEPRRADPNEPARWSANEQARWAANESARSGAHGQVGWGANEQGWGATGQVGWGASEQARTAGAPLDAERGARTYRKGLGLFAAIAAGLASIIAVAALVFVLADRGGQTPARKDDVPTLGGAAPGDVQLRDSGADIEIQWTDPSDGTVSFMVAMGRQGEELKPVATLGPGQTSYELGGLNASLNYCFTVIAVYRSDQFATSPQACTSRAATTPR